MTQSVRGAGIVSALALILSGCGGDGGTGGGGTVTIPAPTPTPSPTASASPTPSPSPSATPSTGTGALGMYASAPDLASCRTGTLTQATRDSVLASVNAIRALHRLPPLAYALVDEQQAADAALMMAANTSLSHTPPSSWTCYSASGSAGAGSSNLYLGSGGGANFPSNEAIMAGWLTEVDNIVLNNVGHRRWMLDPFATRISYGRLAQTQGTNRFIDASSLKVFGFTGSAATPTPLPDYVAYPQGDYPARFFDTRALLSFTAIINKTSSGSNSAVDYSGAQVRVTNGGTALSVSNISYDTVGYGVPNNIQFNVAGLQQNVTYSVAITNVLVRGSATSYNYTFRIVP